jgi:hypothetical protein
MAEDSGGSPLPRRVPGAKRGLGTGPLARPVLSDSDLQRIRAAVDSAQAQAAAPPAERPAPLPRRAPDTGNGSEPPAHRARPESPASLLPTRSGAAPTQPPPAIPAPRSSDEEKASAEQETASREQETASREQETASQEQETASREEVPAGQKNGQASLEKAQPHRTKALARHPKPAPRETPPPPPKPAPPKSAPPAAPASPPIPARPRKRGCGRAIITGSAIVTLVLLSVGSSALLLTRHAGTPRASNDVGAEVPARDRAAAWVASQVGRAGPVSCDQGMCQALQAHGVPAADLLVLKPGGAAPLRSSVVVVTAAVREMVGSRLLAADAPAAIASFGSGAGQISIRLVFPQGAAAYASALRKEIADRKAAGASLLLGPRVTASAATRRQLTDGQVDSRLLLTLAELASQWPLTILAFGDRAPGASPGIPLRSADLALTSGTASPAPPGRVRLMSVFVHQLGDYFAGARIRAVRLAGGQAVVRVEFTAPGQFGLLSTPAR